MCVKADGSTYKERERERVLLMRLALSMVRSVELFFFSRFSFSGMEYFLYEKVTWKRRRVGPS